MLNLLNEKTETLNRWERIQQPVHGTGIPADELRLLAALDEGWQIVETADYLAHGNNAEGRGYLLTLFNQNRHQTREWSIAQSPEIDYLLAFEGVPGFRN
jgi:hypothetical protein